MSRPYKANMVDPSKQTEGDRERDIALPTNVHLMHTYACTHMKETDRQTDRLPQKLSPVKTRHVPVRDISVTRQQFSWKFSAFVATMFPTSAPR